MMVFYFWTDLLGQQTSYLINLQIVVQHEWSCPCRFEILEWERGIGVWVGGGLGESTGITFCFIADSVNSYHSSKFSDLKEEAETLHSKIIVRKNKLKY